MTVKMINDLEAQLANCREYYLGWGKLERVEDNLTYYRSGLPQGQLNGVIRMQNDDAAEVSESFARMTAKMAGLPWMWWVSADSAPGIADELTKNGAQMIGAMPIMAVDIDKVADAPAPEGVTIETVETDEQLEEWVRSYSPSFGVQPASIAESLEIERGRLTPNIVRFSARVDGKVVGTSLLQDHEGVAGVYVVTTDENYRGRGIGTATTAAALVAGRERGLRIGTLQASPMGAPVYTRMGFEVVEHYKLFQLPGSE